MLKRKLGVRRKKMKEVDVDITSLLDILVILLVFLLKNYNASDLKLDLVKGINLPNSSSRELGHYAAIIQVNKDHMISINNKELGNLKNYSMTVGPLFEALEKIKNEDKKKLDGKEESMLRNVNIVLDKDIEYYNMKKIMHTASLVGYVNFKFIVKGNY